ncbi:MAG: DUF1080 domain-containing protein [Labilithrix sp.]|nr:DUF1080 domain-containing protein [Labilithrix sp.]
MRRSLIALAALALCACSSDPSEPIDRIFDGKSLAGLRAFAQPGVDPNSLFRVENDELVVAGAANGYLATERELGDLRIAFEWKWVTPGNSGFFISISGPDAIWPRTVEMQLLVDRAGDLLALGGFPMRKVDDAGFPPPGNAIVSIPHREGREKPVGQWNQGEIAMKNGRVTVKVNDVLVNEAVVPAGERGRVAFEAEGGEIRFRNVVAHAD